MKAVCRVIAAGHLLATGPDGTLIDDPELDRQLTAYAPALRLE